MSPAAGAQRASQTRHGECSAEPSSGSGDERQNTWSDHGHGTPGRRRRRGGGRLARDAAFRLAAVLGLDHIPLAVADLAVAAERYRQLASRSSTAGHTGTASGTSTSSSETGLESSSSRPLRPVTRRRPSTSDTWPRATVPSSCRFFAPELNRVARQLDAEGRAYERANGLLSFPESDRLRQHLLRQRNSSPTDRAEHFRHANGAVALSGVWIAGDELAPERMLLADWAWPFRTRTSTSRVVRGSLARLRLAKSCSCRAPARWCRAGASSGTLRVRDLRPLQLALANGRWQTRAWCRPRTVRASSFRLHHTRDMARVPPGALTGREADARRPVWRNADGGTIQSQTTSSGRGIVAFQK